MRTSVRKAWPIPGAGSFSLEFLEIAESGVECDSLPGAAFFTAYGCLAFFTNGFQLMPDIYAIVFGGYGAKNGQARRV
jgi:hypothetical protein